MTLQEFLAEWNDGNDRVLVHTSGSTGKPKPMWVEKQKMLNSARITCDFLHLREGDTALLCMPLDYIAGKMVVVRSIERKLRLLSVSPSNHPLANVDADVNVDFCAMVPSQVYCSLLVAEEREKLSKIKHLIIGGGAISRELQDKLRNFPNFVWSTYGMTETLSHIALRRLNGKEASDWYTPFPNVNVDVDANDGCFIIDAPLVHDGILKTNDIAELRPDGKFRILGRKDNVICSGGIKLQIEQIEEKLRPYIPQPFCISKRPDEKFGEVAVLLIETEKAPDLTDAFSHLSKYEVPKAVIPVPSIPMTATGKIDRAKSSSIGACPQTST